MFATLGGDAGFPDGMTVDTEGFLWVAHWGGSRVSRYAPDGGVARIVPMPVPNVTSVTFAGPELSTLYITTAREGMTPEQLEAAPEAGGLYRVKTDVRGSSSRQCPIDGGRKPPASEIRHDAALRRSPERSNTDRESRIWAGQGSKTMITIVQGVLDSFLIAFPALFSIVNPPGGALIYSQVTADRNHVERVRLAWQVAFYSAAVMLVALWPAHR